MTAANQKQLEKLIAQVETLQHKIKDDAGNIQKAKDALLRALKS